jgi:hypothetical protein
VRRAVRRRVSTRKITQHEVNQVQRINGFFLVKRQHLDIISLFRQSVFWFDRACVRTESRAELQTGVKKIRSRVPSAQRDDKLFQKACPEACLLAGAGLQPAPPGAGVTF